MSFEPETVPPANNTSGMRQLTMIALFAIMFLVGLILIVVFADPFDWNLLQRLNGNFDASASAMPSDTVAYVGLNLLEANVARMTEIRDAFAAATEGTEFDFEEPIDEVNATFNERLGINFEEDIKPWIGQFMGVGLIEFTLPDFETNDDPTIEWVAVIEVRNTEAADAFLAKMAGEVAEKMEVTAVTNTFQDLTFTTFPSDDPLEEITFGRSDSLVLIGSGLNAVQQAVDAQNGDSLADTVAYQDTVAALPSDRLVTFYMDGTQVNEFVDEAMAEAAANGALTTGMEQLSSTKGMKGIAMGLSVTDAGIQFDTVANYDPAQLSELQQLSFNAWVEEPQTVNIAPQDTLVYFVGSGLDLMWSSLRDMMAQMQGFSEDDFQESMQLFAEQFGINPDTDLFPYLDGELAIIVAPSDSGLIADTTEVGLGATILVGTSNQETLAANIDTFSTTVSDPEIGLGTVTKTEADGLTLYELLSPLAEGMPFTYGIGHNYLLLGSGSDSVAALNFGDDGLSLADSRDFQSVQAAFPNDRTPAIFFNVTDLLDTIRSDAPGEEEVAEFDEMTAFLRPIRYIAATNTIGDNTARGTVIVFIETE
jgi:hypothetical protein